MKKLTVLLVVISVVILLYTRIGKIPATNKTANDNVTVQEVRSPKPVVNNLPVKLQVPRLGIDTTIEEVGMNPDGRMGVPSSAYTVGWWKLGAKPGEKGSAVLAGHYDTPKGTAGVFYDLKQLEAGDQIKVLDSDGENLIFNVVRVATYPDSSFPINEVFAKSDGNYLNLITCAGVWDKGEKNYQDRLVVFAKMKE